MPNWLLCHAPPRRRVPNSIQASCTCATAMRRAYVRGLRRSAMDFMFPTSFLCFAGATVQREGSCHVNCCSFCSDMRPSTCRLGEDTLAVMHAWVARVFPSTHLAQRVKAVGDLARDSYSPRSVASATLIKRSAAPPARASCSREGTSQASRPPIDGIAAGTFRGCVHGVRQCAACVR